MSDHCLIYCLRKFNGARRKDHKVIKTRSMKNFDATAFLTDVSPINWDRIVSRPMDINMLDDDWSNLFSMIIDKYAPISQCGFLKNIVHGLTRILGGSSGRGTFVFSSVQAQHVSEAISKIKLSKSLGMKTFPAISRTWPSPIPKTSLFSCSTPLYNHEISQINGKLPGLHLFLRRVTGHAKKTTGLYVFFRLLPGYLRNLFLTNSTTTLT